MVLKIGIILASLPTYFPKKYGVFTHTTKTVKHICKGHKVDCVISQEIPMDGTDTAKVLQDFQSQNVQAIMLIHGGFTMGDVAREIALSTLPTIIWAPTEPTVQGDVQLNNFVSLNMSMSIFKKFRDCEKYPVEWVYGTPDDTKIIDQLTMHITSLKIKQQLQFLKIGLIGNVAPTFYNMEVSNTTLKQRLGVSVENIDMRVLLENMYTVDQTKIRYEKSKMQQYIDFSAMTDTQIDKTVQCVLALRHIVDEGGYEALAVSDWPVLQQKPTEMHPGMAFSWLEYNDCLPIASEGDVLGAVTQYISLQMTDRVGCILDMTLPQFDTDRILLWHGGGGALSFADGFANGKKVPCIPHPMIGRGTDMENTFGAIADFQFATGEYTVFRVSDDGRGLWAIEGNIVKSELQNSGYTGCRGWLADYNSTNGTHTAYDVVESIMQYGIEHHFILAPTRLMCVLECIAKWCGLKIYAVKSGKER